MASPEEISQHVSEFLSNRISLDEFEDWSASYAWNIHQRADAETAALARLIQAILDAFEDDGDQRGLRTELANAIRPFAIPSIASNRSGDPFPFPVAMSNTENDRDEAISAAA